MRYPLLAAAALTALSYLPLMAQDAGREELRRGINFIETKVFSVEEDAKLLKLYNGLRVSDVSDGLHMAGLPGQCLVDAEIQPAWKNYETLGHQFRGIAITMRYVPTQRVNRPAAGK